MIQGIFEFTESTWVEIIWYVPVEGKFDFLACLFREPADGPWQLRCRFRHYTPDEGAEKIWVSEDRKSVYDIKARREDDPAMIKQELIETADKTCESGAQAFGAEVHRLVVRGHAKKALRMLSRQPWTFKKQISVH